MDDIDGGDHEQIVRRHANWIYSCALRRVGERLAGDITQAVFILWWQKGHALAGSNDARITAWLYRALGYCAANAMRLEQIRQRHEREAAMSRPEAQHDANWSEVAEVLETAVDRLGKADRQAVLLRFYRGLSVIEVAAALGLGEEAAKKRIQRALQRLRTTLAKQNVCIGAMALETALIANLSASAPNALVTTLLSTLTGHATATAAGISEGAAGMMSWAKVKVAAMVGLGLLSVGGLVVAVAMAGNSPAAQAAAPQPATAPAQQSFTSGITPLAPGEQVPDAAALVREIRQAESWIDTARTFRVQAQAKWLRTPEQIEARRAQLQKQFPRTPVNPQTFPELLPEIDDSLDLAFDAQRLYKREESANSSRLLDVRIWDGKQAIIHELYPKQEHYALDKEPSRFIGQFFLNTLCWPGSGPHPFWWLREAERQTGDDFYGRPEDFTCVGRAQFRGVECYVLECDLFYRRWHVGINDHRLYATENRVLPRGKDRETTAIILELARDHGQNLRDTQQYRRWEVSLPPEQRRTILKEYFRRLRPVSVPYFMFWYADYREVAPGCWMPMTQGQRNYDPERAGAAEADRLWTITSAQVNQPLPDDLFTMQFKEGVDVNDWSHDPPLFYKHKASFSPQQWQAILDEANQRKREDEANRRKRGQ